mgnify:CR=1 FL=1
MTEGTDSAATHHPEVSSLTSGAVVSPTLKQAQPAGPPTCTPDSGPCSGPCQNRPNLIRILRAQNLFCSQVKVNPRLFRLKPIDVGIPSHDIFEVPMEGNILQR